MRPCFEGWRSLLNTRHQGWPLALIALWLIGFGGGAQAANLSDVRVGLHGALTRFVIESDTKFPFRLFQLQNPARLIVDLPNMQRDVAELPLSNQSPLIEKSRYGLFRPDVLRVVLDLSTLIAIHQSRQYQNAAGKWLLVIEMAAPDASHAVTTKATEVGWRAYFDSRQFRTATPKSALQAEFTPKGVISAPRRKQSYVPIVVMIDPGHGGLDPGAIGYKNTFEKDVVLGIAKRLQNQLKQRGFRALLTRDADFYVPLAERYRIAQKHQARLFVSLHADAAENSRATGASIYTLSEKASDREAAKLARKENASDVLVGVSDFEEYDASVQRILLSMSQRVTQFESSVFASAMLKQLSSAINLKSHAYRSAGFTVLKSPSVPSILIELGYMSNPDDRKKLLDPKHCERLAITLAAGIADYFTQRKKNRTG